METSVLNAAALLSAWEAGASQPPVQRGLTLLTTGWPETSAAEWGSASIGERDGRLLSLREELFGSSLEATAACPECGEALELTFATEDVRVAAPALPAPDDLRVQVGGFDVRFRLPTSNDLLEVAQSLAADGRQTLLEHCVRDARSGDVTVDPKTLPTEVDHAVMEVMAKADPQAEVGVALSCPACSHHWSMTFDILSYLWDEVDDWAQRMLLEVHALACAYGWSERDILAMSARRRQLYLELMGA